MLREAIKEARSKYKVYFVTDTLWLAYGQGSGSTTYIPNITKYITNKSNDATYDSNVETLVKWSKTEKPLKQNEALAWVRGL